MSAMISFISLGWGVQSWSLVAMSALGELPKVDYAIHADTGHERQGTYQHAAKWSPWLAAHGIEVVTVRSARTGAVEQANTPAVMIPAFAAGEKRGQLRRQCTVDWKIRPIRRFLRSKLARLPIGAVESWQGISLDEFHRMRSSDVAYIQNVYPLVERRLTRQDCITWLRERGLDVPPKSACTFCPYHSLGAWEELRKAGGSDWAEAKFVDATIRNKRPMMELFIHPAMKPLEDATETSGQLNLDLEVPCDGGTCFT